MNNHEDHLGSSTGTAESLSTTAGTVPAQTFTLADLERVEQMIRAMPKPPWILIAPDGRAWQDTDPQALLRVLAGAVLATWPSDFQLPG